VCGIYYEVSHRYALCGWFVDCKYRWVKWAITTFVKVVPCLARFTHFWVQASIVAISTLAPKATLVRFANLDRKACRDRHRPTLLTLSIMIAMTPNA